MSVKVGVIGVGAIGRNHARIYAALESADLVAIYDADPERARALAARNVPADAPAYRAWAFRIVRNAALDELRARAPRETFPPEIPVDVWGFDDAFIAKITVEQGLAAISPAHREIIGLIDIAGFSYGEAAHLLGVPAGTVMSRLARARAALLYTIQSSSLRPLKSNHGS